MRIVFQLLAGVLTSGIGFWASGLYGSENVIGRLELSGAICFAVALLIESIEDGGGLIRINAAIYMIFYLSFPGQIHAARNRFPFFQMQATSSEVARGAFYIFLFSAMFYLGALAARRSTTLQRAARSDAKDPASVSASLMLIAVAGAVLASLGPSSFLIDRLTDFDVTSFGNEATQALHAGGQYAAAIGALTVAHRVRCRGWSATDVALAITLVLLNLVINYPLGVARFTLAAYLITFIYLMFPYERRSFKIAYVLVMIIGTSTIFPFVSFLQRGEPGTDFDLDPTVYFATSGDLDGFQSVINVAKLVDDKGLRFGWHMLSAALVVIPRSVWPDKALPTGQEAADNAGYLYNNISAPLPSELLIDFGILGVAVGALIGGYLLSRFDVRRIGEGKSLWTVLICGGLAGLIIIILRGSLLAVSGPIGSYFFLSFLTLGLSARSRRFPSRTSSRLARKETRGGSVGICNGTWKPRT